MIDFSREGEQPGTQCVAMHQQTAMLQKDENGLWPGQRHPLDIPDFIRTLRAPASPASSPPASSPNWVPPWAAKS